VHVHDLVDNVVWEGEWAGFYAELCFWNGNAAYAENKSNPVKT
jgi:hypothetical protein